MPNYKDKEKRIDYKEEYKKIYSNIELYKVLESYNIFYKTYNSKNGLEYMFSCPFPDHDDSSPSFSICEKTGVYNCFICGGGDFFSFIKNIEGLKTIKDTIIFLKNKLGIVDDKQETFDYVKSTLESIKEIKEICSEDEEEEIKEIKLPKSIPAEKKLSIVKKRVNIRTIKKWKLRYSVDDRKYNGRLIVPIYFQGKLVSFIARDMLGRTEVWNKIKKQAKKDKISKKEMIKLTEEQECKKILLPFGAPISRVFFNWDNALKHKTVILCEGVFDAIKVCNFGYNAIAILSCHLNDYRIGLLIENFDIIYIALDNDDKINKKGEKVNPGQKAAKKIMKELVDCEVYNIVLPVGKDPDDCTEEEFTACFNQSKVNKNLFKLSF